VDEGGKTCCCLLCFEKGLERDRRIDDVGTSVDHLQTTDTDTLSVPPVGIEEDRQQDMVTLRNESSSRNPVGRVPGQVLMRRPKYLRTTGRGKGRERKQEFQLSQSRIRKRLRRFWVKLSLKIRLANQKPLKRRFGSFNSSTYSSPT
jgi:hypothetical protein